MRGFFNLDSPFSRLGNMLADIMILGMLWLLFSLPIVTIGASTTALFYVVTKRISNKEAYVTKDFLRSFKSNFLQSTIIWLGMLFFYFVIFLGIFVDDSFGKFGNYILPFQLFLLLEMTIVSIYIFPIIARFHMKNLQVIKTAFFMGNKHILTSVFSIVMAFTIIIAIPFFPPIFLIAMSLYAFTVSGMIVKVFKKYRPELDDDSFEGYTETQLTEIPVTIIPDEIDNENIREINADINVDDSKINE